MSVLDKICTDKAEHIRVKKAQKSISDLEELIKARPPGRGFYQKLKNNDGAALIAEVKKASPSKGIIRENFDPINIANTYEQAGSTCLSVLTDIPYFQGDDDYLVQISETVQIPVLRKDFMIDPYQIFESRSLGADCILLIMAALSDEQAKELFDLSHILTMDVLVEAHDIEEVERALRLGSKMVGVNSRNLKTLDVDINVAKELAKMIPEKVLSVAESGIDAHEDIISLSECGYDAFLVGESLMKKQDIASAVKELMGTN